ncbi:MAG: ATP-binding protein [Candidatus Sumerlaeia bacterium]|nr:ATP-binding protein [Candidatus Sumerlaeia bacterium]
MDLKQSNVFLNVLLENITSAIFIVDKDIRIHSFNDSFRVLFSKPEEKLIGTLCGNAIGCKFVVEEGKDCGNTSNCDKCELRCALLKSFTERVPVYKEKLKREFYINEQPITKYFVFSTRYITYNNEEMTLVIVDDVTEIETQRIKLEELNQLKNEFLGIAAHDLRNPIAIVKMYSDFILHQDSENLSPQQIEFLKKINKNSEFMLNLLEDLLDVSKIEAGKLDLQLTPGDYVAFVKNNIELNRTLAAKKGIQINMMAVPPIPEIAFDKNKMEQVLNNLISNAIKYSFPNTTINVKIFKENNSVITQVIDQGQGIPAEELPNLFKEFHKTSVKATAGEKSTGLGLAIVKKIIEGHRGKIGVYSEVGKGSTFYFSLPLRT